MGPAILCLVVIMALASAMLWLLIDTIRARKLGWSCFYVAGIVCAVVLAELVASVLI